MRSRTSFFNMTVLKKNITRYAPAWALYSVFLLMLMMLMSDFGRDSYYVPSLAEAIAPFALFNGFYALLCAQLLFGDLYNSRMCNALHAMPLRREGWFITNIVSGLAFSVVPNAVFAVISLPLAEGLWQIPLLWLAGVTLQYVFFFGVAVLSAYCVGSRFAMGLVYIIINGFSIIAYWLVATLYAPHLYGVVISEDIFLTLSPLVSMIQHDYLEVNTYGGYSWYFESGWGYLGICAGIGLIAMALALLAYRRRDLESAGDFIAIRWLSPVFLVLYTLCGGACCHGFFSLFIGEESYFFLLLGFVIGFFTGYMLLERTVRVFRKKSILGFGIFVLVFSLSFLAVQVDILGITRWVPKASQVSSVVLTTGSGRYGAAEEYMLTEQAQIEDVLLIHRHGVSHRNEARNDKEDNRVFLTYRMKDGSERKREYVIDIDTEAGQLVRSYMSRPSVVLGDLLDKKSTVVSIRFPDPDILITDDAQIRDLLAAVSMDAEAEKMPQDWAYVSEAEYTFWIEVEYRSPEGLHMYRDIRANGSCDLTIAWMEAHGIKLEKWYK